MKFCVFAILLVAGFHYGSAALEKVECNYVQDEYDYICELHITNPNGLDSFTSIDGTHLAGFGNADVVRVVRNVASYTTRIPSIICNTFTNLASFDFHNDFVASVDDNAFRGCTNLHMLSLSTNNIASLSTNAFRFNTGLWMLYLDNNRLTELPRTLLSSEEFLISLNLNGNSISTIHFDSFGDHPNLSYLSLSRNTITAFDERVINYSNIYSLEFTGNSCASGDFTDESENRDTIRAALSVCFQNYVNQYGRK
ncbi:unnamed protein product [Chironomus riparius]|uniref:Leucine-rich repeat protein n=1 Tax=Chironomus riparius TaxID=315576 RepID=A0A9N9RNZ1_9DIPT|nr:unnamed protein product [Chironomus riparius]